MFKEFLTQRLKRGLVRHFNNLKIARKAKLVIQKTPKTSGAPIIFFKAWFSFACLLGNAFAGSSNCLFCLSFWHESLCVGHEPR
jgi:hypothetical protein